GPVALGGVKRREGSATNSTSSRPGGRPNRSSFRRARGLRGPGPCRLSPSGPTPTTSPVPSRLGRGHRQSLVPARSLRLGGRDEAGGRRVELDAGRTELGKSRPVTPPAGSVAPTGPRSGSPTGRGSRTIRPGSAGPPPSGPTPTAGPGPSRPLRPIDRTEWP